MKTKQLFTGVVAGLMIAGLFTGCGPQEPVPTKMKMTTAGAADMPTDPIGGQPPVGVTQSVDDLDYQVLYHRAFETAIWSMPMVNIYNYYKGAMNLGAAPNTILAWSKPAKPNGEFVTGNNQTPYILSQTDLSKGPVVVEVPAVTEKSSIYGQIVDHWQNSVADVGPTGLDKGKGVKILLLPPGYDGKVPDGYAAVKSTSYRVCFAFRSIKKANATTEDAYAFSKTLKMYYLSELPNPAPTKFIDPYNLRFSSIPKYDETWFQDLHDIISLENVSERDKYMMGMLATLGIEKGKPYKPDEKTLKAMKHGIADAYYYLHNRIMNPTDESRIWWKDKHWYNGLFSDKNRMFTYEYENTIDLDNKGDRYHIGTYYPKKLPKLPGTQYLFALYDNQGNPLEADKTYSFTMPAKVPVKQFWSLIIYDVKTFGFIYSKEALQGLSSYDLPNMKKNKDGSVTIYFGPKAPKGLESNWIPTSGKRPFPVMRFYAGTEEFWDRSWTMPDVELVK